MSRWKAAGIHFGLSALIATVVLVAMYLLWYPPPYFKLMGGAVLVMLIVGCDVVIGPSITAIIFKSGKKGLKFDLAVIGLVQAAALAYGLYTMFEARPVFTVFAVDRFEVVAANDIKPEDLAQARSPEFASFPLTGPRVVAAQLPTDPKEKSDLMFALNRAGQDIKNAPRLYVPYDTVAAAAAKKARPIEALQDPAARDKVSKAMRELPEGPDKLGFLPLVGRFEDMCMIVDKSTGRMLKTVEASPW